MRKSLIAAGTLMGMLGAAAHAQGIQITPAGTSPTTPGAPANFVGHVTVDMKAAGDSRKHGSVGAVDFAPGARTAWHTHPVGQLLIITDGKGWVQEDGNPRRGIQAGDVVWIEAGVRHWHGAAQTSGMRHLAIAYMKDGKSAEWQELVSDEQYNAPARRVTAALALALAASSCTTVAPAPNAQELHDMTDVQPAPDALSARQQAVPLIASFMAASDMPGLNAALNQGLDAGLTISEAREVLVQLYAYAGFPKSLNALGELLKVVQARQQRGIQDAPGREPGRAIPVGDELVAIGKANQTKISGGPVKNAVTDFAPVINQYLQAHLFGDIFERDNLDWQSRELATIGALAAMPGVEAQLRSHMRASLRVGLTAVQLHQLVQVLAERGDADAARRASEALSQALAAASGG